MTQVVSVLGWAHFAKEYTMVKYCIQLPINGASDLVALALSFGRSNEVPAEQLPIICRSFVPVATNGVNIYCTARL